jgi:hypothetical protein
MEQADPLDTLFARAKEHRVPMAAICTRAKIAPTTPSRWRRKKNGATLDKVTQLTGALAEIIAENAA